MLVEELLFFRNVETVRRDAVLLVLQDAIGGSVVGGEEDEILSLAEFSVEIAEELGELFVQLDILFVRALVVGSVAVTGDVGA